MPILIINYNMPKLTKRPNCLVQTYRLADGQTNPNYRMTSFLTRMITFGLEYRDSLRLAINFSFWPNNYYLKNQKVTFCQRKNLAKFEIDSTIRTDESTDQS